MFFPASKIFTALALPSSIVVLLLGIGLLLVMVRPQAARLGKRLALTGLALLLAFGLSPIGNALILPLEQRAAALAGGARTGTSPVTGLIVLGGFEEGWLSAGRRSLAINEAAERLTETLRLARREPAARIVFTGGSGNFLVSGAEAADLVRQYLIDVGVAPDRIVLEGKSRNTHENAVFTRAVVEPQPGERWLLVTSAYHMPRSIGIFRRAGFEVEAFPVDFRLRETGDMLRAFDSIPDGLKRVDLAMREYAGLLAYWLTGRSESLWPAPR